MALKAQAQQRALREGKAQEKKSFAKREREKRKTGVSSKSYVEEEKRIAREAGHYSGFD